MADESLVKFFRPFPFGRFSSVWDDDDAWLMHTGTSGLSISEDDAHIYIEAHVPGVDPKDIDVTFDKGVLWIKGESKEEEKKKKYYRKAVSSFSYRASVPGDIDPDKEPDAKYKNGVMTVTFTKAGTRQPKRLTVKT